MTITVKRPIEIMVDSVHINVPVRYGTEDISADFPLRSGDSWEATIDIETGKIREWPSDAGAKSIHMKVTDNGCYRLLAGDDEIASLDEEYVPGFFPGEHYGDYIIFNIGADGVIEDWSRKATEDRIQQSFFSDEE